jgi:hypothetical protein
VAVDSLLLLIWATPSKFIMKPPWDSERSPGFSFTYQKQKKVCCSSVWRIGRLADCLDSFAAIRSPDCGTSGVCFFVLPQNWPWDDDMRLFGLKIGCNVARSFLTKAALMVLLLDLNTAAAAETMMSAVVFVFFSSFTALTIQFV